MFLKTKIKVVFTRRQLPIDEPWIKRHLHMKYADQMVVTSLAIRDSLIQKGFRASQISVIPNGIKSDLFDGIPKTDQKAESEIVIGCVSRLKRQDILIDALPLLPANWTILFVGISKNDILIQSAVKQRLLFTGRISREKALHYYDRMDVHLLLSDAEGFGKTLLEAMLAGVPNVASQVGGICEVIQSGENGLLIKNDPRELADSLLKLVANRELYDQIVREGRRTSLEIFPLEKTVEKFEALFQTIIASK